MQNQHNHAHKVPFPAMRGSDAIYFRPETGLDNREFSRSNTQVTLNDHGVQVDFYDTCRNLITTRTYPWGMVAWIDQDTLYESDNNLFFEWFQAEHGMSIKDYREMMEKSEIVRALSEAKDITSFLNEDD